jgi:hypothetical protein
MNDPINQQQSSDTPLWFENDAAGESNPVYDPFGSDDTIDTEDPMTKGQSHANQVPAFRARAMTHSPRHKVGNALPSGMIPNLTPGARRIQP